MSEKKSADPAKKGTRGEGGESIGDALGGDGKWDEIMNEELKNGFEADLKTRREIAKNKK